MAATTQEFIPNPFPRSKAALADGLIAVVSPFGFHLPPTPSSRSGPTLKAFTLMLLMFIGASASIGFSQALPAAESRLDAGAFVIGGLMNTQHPHYSDNALGVSFGAFLQHSPKLGFEARAGVYPYSARYVQALATGGIRFSSRASRDWHPQLFGYLGGGMTRAHEENSFFEPAPAKWYPCWQTAVGIDLPLHRWKWRVFEASWSEAYTPQSNLRSLTVNTGLVYTLGH